MRFFSLIFMAFVFPNVGLTFEGETWEHYIELEKAAKAGDYELVEDFLDRGLDTNYSGMHFRKIPLAHAPIVCDQLSEDHITVMKLFLENGMNVNAVNSPNNDTALTELAYCDDRNEVLLMAELLLSYGADAKHIGSSNMSALYRSILRGNERLAIILAPHGVVEEREIKRAMTKKMELLLTLFIDLGAEYKSFPLLHFSIGNSHDQLLQRLLKNGVSPSRFMGTSLKGFEYPIIYAATVSNFTAVKLLHEYGASLYVTSKRNESLRQIARKKNNGELVQWLEKKALR